MPSLGRNRDEGMDQGFLDVGTVVPLESIAGAVSLQRSGSSSEDRTCDVLPGYGHTDKLRGSPDRERTHGLRPAEAGAFQGGRSARL